MHYPTVLSIATVWKFIQEFGAKHLQLESTKSEKIFQVVFSFGLLVWLVARLFIALLPIGCYILSMNLHENGIDTHLKSIKLTIVWETGLIIWFLLMQSLWVIGFANICYRYYYHLLYVTLIPYFTFAERFDYKHVKNEYFRVLTSITVRQILDEYFNRDVSNIILLYHDNMDLTVPDW